MRPYSKSRHIFGRNKEKIGILRLVRIWHMVVQEIFFKIKVQIRKQILKIFSSLIAVSQRATGQSHHIYPFVI